jgi:hypothetical protein
LTPLHQKCRQYFAHCWLYFQQNQFQMPQCCCPQFYCRRYRPSRTVGCPSIGLGGSQHSGLIEPMRLSTRRAEALRLLRKQDAS